MGCRVIKAERWDKNDMSKDDMNKNDMDKEQWLQTAGAVLEDIFRQVKEFEDPITAPFYEEDREIPQPERLNGLAVSFLAAAPLLRNDPEAVAGGYLLREYYKNQILKCVEPDFPRCLLVWAEDEKSIFQNTWVCAALCFGLAMCKREVWDCYTKEERDQIAGLFASLGNGGNACGSGCSSACGSVCTSACGSGGQGIFHMLILAFLNREGYSVDADWMRDLAWSVLSSYVGDGWYRDGKAFDYDSFWALQVFGPLWNRWYGYEHEPYIAWKFEEYSNTLVRTLPNLFDKDGRVIRWGRDGLCQSAAAAPLAANFFLNHPEMDPGVARTVISRTLRHALGERKDFYSTALFFCLAFPDGHPFWTAPGSEGECDEDERAKVRETVLDGPGLVVANMNATTGSNADMDADTNSRRCHAVELRTAKVLLERSDAELQSYSRLAFHSRYPWEDFDLAGAEAMQYCLLRKGEDRVWIPNLILSGGYRGEVLYRKAYFDFVPCTEDVPAIALADFSVANGLIRVDRVHMPGRTKPGWTMPERTKPGWAMPYTLTLGAYGMPVRGTISVERRKKGGARALILSSGEEQMAFVTYAGFDSIEKKQRQGVNPAARDSILMYGVCRRNQEQAQSGDQSRRWEGGDFALISAVLHKNGCGQWSDEELFPIKGLRFGDRQQSGGCGPISLRLRDGRSISVDFEALDGKLTI